MVAAPSALLRRGVKQVWLMFATRIESTKIARMLAGPDIVKGMYAWLHGAMVFHTIGQYCYARPGSLRNVSSAWLPASFVAWCIWGLKRYQKSIASSCAPASMWGSYCISRRQVREAPRMGSTNAPSRFQNNLLPQLSCLLSTPLV